MSDSHAPEIVHKQSASGAMECCGRPWCEGDLWTNNDDKVTCPGAAPTSRARAARKRPTTATAIRFKPELLAQLHDEADARELSVNWLVNRAVEEFLRRLIPVSEVLLTRDPAPYQGPG